MTEDDTFRMLKATVSITSKHGGYYYFIPDRRITAGSVPSGVFGHIHCAGNIYDIIKNKKRHGQLITEWLCTGYKQESVVRSYTVMCDIYATHITVTYPEPGKYWQWAE